ncbi:MAG: PQQ-dependent sugar dehydrogenase [Pirellula sp.]
MGTDTPRFSLLVFAFIAPMCFVLSHAQDESKGPTTRRTSWELSKIRGTPDPPPPYSLKRAYPNLSFMGPVSIHSIPKRAGDTSNRFAVVLQSGKLFCFDEDEQVEKVELMIDLAKPPPKFSEFKASDKHSINAFSMAFHPEFATNNYVYICYLVNKSGGNHPDGTHIARYKMTATNPPTIDYESETTIIRFVAGGHNGCTLEFGPDGYLYISIGDIADPTPPDPYKTGQDISDVYSSILRIDVDRPSKDGNGKELPYTIPADNPFVALPKARGEVYAFGFRNPWRMSFDRATGDLWVGDVGWEAFEMVYRVRSGGNYGWSIKEGPGDVLPDLPIGPAPISPPDITLGHSDAASVTGGFVYRGDLIPGLRGKYVFGDWITRRFWAAEFDKQRVTNFQEIAYGEVKPICFALDHRGELLVLEYIQGDQKGGIYRFVPNPAAASYVPNAFPTKLSQTGLFRDVKKLEPNEGVVEYSLNSTMWMDGAEPIFHLAMPGSDPARMYQSPQTTFDWFKTKVQFPKGTVLVKSYYVLNGQEKRLLETQISHYEGPNDWRFYSYAWLDDQSDAVLVPAEGVVHPISQDKSNSLALEKSHWNFASRSQCRICHTPWSGDALGFIEEQLRKPTQPTDVWRGLFRLGILESPKGNRPKSDDAFTPMMGLDGRLANVHVKARSYLHSNCAHCHQFGGNGAAGFDIRFEKSLLDTKTFDVTPLKGGLQLEDAKLIAAGDPNRSVLFYRDAKSGSGRMPHVGAETVDRQGVQLLNQWILSIPRSEEHRNWFDKLTGPLQRFNREDRISAARELLATPSTALYVMNALADGIVPAAERDEVLKLANVASEASRDVLESFLPVDQRLVRLGTNFDKQLVLKLSGDAIQGKQLLLNGVGQCVQCHRFGDKGKDVGPPLAAIGAKYPEREQMLEHLVDPSLTIAPGFRSSTIVTTDNETIVGRVSDRSEKKWIVILADGKSREIDASDVELEKESTQSMMPEGLLAPLTPKQAIDIVEYLRSLKETLE